jgi:hypothetical protein
MRVVVMVFVVWLAAVPAAAQDPEAARIEAMARRRFRHEPSVHAVLRAALERLRARPETIDDARTRARWSGLVPTVRAGVRRGLAQDTSSLVGEEPRTNVGTDDDLSLQADVSFDLDRLLFSREEVSLYREIRSSEAAEQALVREIVTLYFERQRIVLERELGAAPNAEAEIRVLEIEAFLDAISGGRFTRRRD